MSGRNVINRNELPEILSEEEFMYYFNKFKDGCNDSLNILVIHNVKLVYWYIDNYIRFDDNIYDFNDLFSVGLEALVESFYNFDISRNVKFSTYVTICIRNKIAKYFRTENKHSIVVSYDKYVNDNENDDSFLDLIVDNDVNLEEDFINNELDQCYRDVINSSLELLDDIDREIIKLYFGFYNGKLYVQREISEKLGLSQSRISKRIASSLKIIKNIIIEKELECKSVVFAKKVA